MFFISGLLFFSLVALALAGEAEAVKLKPDAGELKVTRVEKPNKPAVLEAVFPIQPTDKKSFSAEITVAVSKWRGTGIHAGFGNSKNGRVFEVWLQDDHMGHGSANINVFLAEDYGFRFEGAFCQMPFETRNILVALTYDAPLCRFKAKACDSNDRKRVFGESEWMEVKGFFTVDQFVVRAMTLNKEKEKKGPALQPGSSVTWDQAGNGLRVFSQMSANDIMEALIKNVTIKTEE
jgi:hypothetical protein